MAVVLPSLARLYPWPVDTSEQLVDAMAFSGLDVEPETVVRAGYGAGIVALFGSFLFVSLTSLSLWVGLVVSTLLSVVTIHGVHTSPRILAAIRRTKALGDVPGLIGRAVLRMQIEPATESAVTFAAETGDGPLAESLDDHIDGATGTPRTGLVSFAEEWAEEFPALRRAAHLLVAAESVPDDDRRRALERALVAVLDGTRNQMAEFTSNISGPATGIYAFGVMLPLALVALVPAATIAGYPVSIWFFVVVYNVILPTLLVIAGGWLLIRRPVAFPPPMVTRDHPDVPDSYWIPVAFGGVVGMGAVFVTPLVAPDALASVAGIGLGIGIALTGMYRPMADVRARVHDVEEHLVDALYLVGRRVTEGEAVETAIVQAGNRVPGSTGDVFENAAMLQRRLHLTVEEAFRGEYGALANVPSPRAHSTTSLLAIAAREGQPAGRAIVSMAEHLEELQEVEEHTRRELSAVTGTLDNTASFFGPMVAGSTVALAGGMSQEGVSAADATTLPNDQLALVVGIYVLSLTVILTAISIALRYGFDQSVLGYRVGRALSISIPIYILSVVLVGMVM